MAIQHGANPGRSSRTCEECLKKEYDLHEEQEAKSNKRERAREWSRFCPALYQQTNLDDPRMNKEAVEFVRAWEDKKDGIGIAFRGPTGRGKTRLSYALLRRLFMVDAEKRRNPLDEQSDVDAISATRLAALCVESYDNNDNIRDSARERLRLIRRVDYLLIDDLGKQKFTERAEVELYDLIEVRTSNLRPTFWTANMTRDAFAAMLSEDRGEPIIRRLMEFSQVISI